MANAIVSTSRIRSAKDRYRMGTLGASLPGAEKRAFTKTL